MKLLALAFLTLSLAGCGTLDLKMLENRIVCTVAKDEAHVVSKYGPFGLASKIAKADADVVCK